jgi:hypothetical protein
MGGNFGMPGLDGAESSGDIDIFAFAGSCQPSALNCTDPFSPDDPIACDRGVGGQPGNAITTNNYQFTYNGIIVPANSYPLPSVLPPTPISGGQPLTGVAGPVVQ